MSEEKNPLENEQGAIDDAKSKASDTADALDQANAALADAGEDADKKALEDAVSKAAKADAAAIKVVKAAEKKYISAAKRAEKSAKPEYVVAKGKSITRGKLKQLNEGAAADKSMFDDKRWAEFLKRDIIVKNK